jgi:glycosyltransferase involved in cell wall biosynthesis
MVNSLVIIGPGWPLRGGLSAFDEQLARTFNEKKVESTIVSFSLQYPSLLFPGTTQYSNEPAPKEVTIFSIINSINPFNWIRVGLRLKKQKPDLIIVRYWIPFLAPSLGTICRIAKSNKHTKVISIVDNMIPHEKRLGDSQFTSYFAKSVDGFLAMSQKVANDIRRFSDKPLIISPHPIFAHFGNPISKSAARNILGIQEDEKVILFFGFIRQYKGLDLLINAMATAPLKRITIKLMIVGEFYEDAQPYHDLIKNLGLEERIILYTQFVPDHEVKTYVCSADFIIQPYRNATQSGVTPLAYHFEIPMLVTNVGALADTVPDGKVGFVVEPTVNAIANGIVQLYEKGSHYFIPHIKEEKKKYSWEQMADNFLNLHTQL